MTVWTDPGKKKLRKHYWTNYLRRVDKTFCDLHCDEERTKVIGFSIFCDLRLKNILLLGSQRKCMIHGNLF